MGARVTIGHGAVVHGCTIEDDCLIGMHATVMNRAVIGSGSLIAAGALVVEGTVVPPGSLVAGVPGKVRREVTADEAAAIRRGATSYVRTAQLHRDALAPQAAEPPALPAYPVRPPTLATRPTDLTLRVRRWGSPSRPLDARHGNLCPSAGQRTGPSVGCRP